MAKGYKKNPVRIPVIQKGTNGNGSKSPDSLFFWNSAGKKVYFMPVSTVVLELIVDGTTQSYKERGEPVDVPTYQVEAVGGVMQTFKHDETTLRTEEQKKAWAAYKEATYRLEAEINAKRTEACLLCIQADPEEDRSWRARQIRLGIKIPEPTEDNPDALFLHYVETEVLKTAEDIMTAVGEIVAAGMRGVIPQDRIDAAKSSFRGVLANVERELDSSGKSGADPGAKE